ncbi:G-patch domain and KOW motifs-containing protein [Dendroctonus ponderosae]
MEPVKLSFGFKKPLKKACLLPQAPREPETEGRKELIDCLEGQAIKVKGAVEAHKAPLVIPLKDNQKDLLDRIRAARSRPAPKQLEDLRPDSELSEQELAARQLIKEAKARLENGSAPSGHKVTVLPLTEPPLEGEKEPTLEDYESVPINDYGLALLRGMGWTEGMPIGKKAAKGTQLQAPEQRPKGLGLGATAAVQAEAPPQPATDQHGKQLVLAKGGCARVLAGPHKAHYCSIQGFDEEGRVFVKVLPQGALVNINETLLTPVTQEEFTQGSRFLNTAKFLEHQQKEEQPSHSRRAQEERPMRRSRNKKCKSRHRRGASSDEDERPRSRKH